MNKKFLGFASAAAVGLAALAPVNANAVAVDLELALLVDVSGSVDNTEYALQRTGYIQAFQNAAIQDAIIQLGGIAVTYIEWSGASQQSTRVAWTLIDSVATANAFATAISNTTRAFAGSTAPGSALNFARPLFGLETGGTATNGFDSLRQVIDVSGDGQQNDGVNTAAARDAALAAGVDTINGLPILGDEAGLLAWYTANIKGGATGFVVPAATFADFSGAVQTKIFKEITQTPEPGSLALLGLGLLGLGASRRRKAA